METAVLVFLRSHRRSLIGITACVNKFLSIVLILFFSEAKAISASSNLRDN